MLSDGQVVKFGEAMIRFYIPQRIEHSKPTITLDVYGHLIPSKQEEAA
jgi:hypothetical protein